MRPSYLDLSAIVYLSVCPFDAVDFARCCMSRKRQQKAQSNNEGTFQALERRPAIFRSLRPLFNRFDDVTHMHSPSPRLFMFGTSISGATKTWCAATNVSTKTLPSTKSKTQIPTHPATFRRHVYISGLTLEPGNSRSKAQYKRLHIPAADVWGIRLFQRSAKVSDSTHLSETMRMIAIRIFKCKQKNFHRTTFYGVKCQ